MKTSKQELISHLLLLFLIAMLAPASALSDQQQLCLDQRPAKWAWDVQTAADDSKIGKGGDTGPENLEKVRAILNQYKTGLSAAARSRLAHLIYDESLKYGYEPELILALVIRESSFYNWSRSKKGALGLMQILPTTGRELAELINVPWNGKETLFNPDINIRMGIHYLAHLHSRFGALETALTAYNYGPARIARMIERGKTLPTGYANRILATYRFFVELKPHEIIEALGQNGIEAASEGLDALKSVS